MQKSNLILKLGFMLKLNLILKLGFILKFAFIQNFEFILNILEHLKPSISSLKQPGRLAACYLEITLVLSLATKETRKINIQMKANHLLQDRNQNTLLFDSRMTFTSK